MRGIATAACILGRLRQVRHGLTKEQLREQLQVSITSVRRVLGELMDAGQIGREPCGEKTRTVYCMRSQVPAVRAHHAKIKAELAITLIERRKARDSQYGRRKREVQSAYRRAAQAQTADQFEAEFCSMPVHLIVPAHQCAPLGKRGPCSVWELAA